MQNFSRSPLLDSLVDTCSYPEVMMKKISLNLVFLCLLLTACSTKQDISPISPSTATTSAAEPPELPAINEDDVNLDLELQNKLKGIWKNYFVEEFNDTRAVNVIVITNRLLKGKNFGCTDDSFGVETDTNFRLGTCRINVPRNHSTGELKFTKDQRENSNDFFKIIAHKELYRS